jgi:hypothetical protein
MKVFWKYRCHAVVIANDSIIAIKKNGEYQPSTLHKSIFSSVLSHHPDGITRSRISHSLKLKPKFLATSIINYKNLILSAGDWPELERYCLWWLEGMIIFTMVMFLLFSCSEFSYLGKVQVIFSVFRVWFRRNLLSIRPWN